MPKIFLIKNRLRQQQLLLNQEQQNGANNKNDLGHGDSQPLSLIVHKKEEGKTPTVNKILATSILRQATNAKLIRF